MKIYLTPLLALLCLLLLTNCTTPPKVDWDARVGVLTFDEAVRELGPPEKSAVLTDKTKVADWLVSRGRTEPTFHSFPDGSVLRTEGVRGMDQVLRLTFTQEGKLSSWKRVWR